MVWTKRIEMSSGNILLEKRNGSCVFMWYNHFDRYMWNQHCWMLSSYTHCNSNSNPMLNFYLLS